MFWASNCMMVIPNIRHLSCYTEYLWLTDGIRTCYWQQLFSFNMLKTNGEPGTELYSLSKCALQIQPRITYKGLKTVTTYSLQVLLSVKDRWQTIMQGTIYKNKWRHNGMNYKLHYMKNVCNLKQNNDL
jgi:hypothetical protein